MMFFETLILGCSILTMMHASILAIWYVIKWHNKRPMQKKLEYSSENSHPAMLLKFWPFLGQTGPNCKRDSNDKFWFLLYMAVVPCLVFTGWLVRNHGVYGHHTCLYIPKKFIVHCTVHCTLCTVLYTVWPKILYLSLFS